MIAYFIVPALCMIPIGVYLYFYLKRMAGFFHVPVEKNLIRISLIVAIIAIVILCINVFSLQSMILLHITAISVVCDLLFLLYKKCSKNRRKSICKIHDCGLIPILITVIIMICGYFHMYDINEKDYTVLTQKNIREQGYTVALISDLHYGTTIDAAKLREYCKDISNQRPDFVVLDGDIVDERTTKEQLKECMEALSSIESTYGSYYVYGNHDRAHYSSHAPFTEDELRTALTDNGIQILKDQTYELNDDIILIGRDDRGYASSYTRKTIKELVSNVDTSKFLLLLDHQPVELKANEEAGIDLMLSGHTHGGQIWPVGLISDLLNFGEINYGYKEMNGFQVIVSSGIAGWGYPIRTGSDSEYVIIKIEKEP